MMKAKDLFRNVCVYAVKLEACHEETEEGTTF
jgi:hypothetical protein